MARDLEGWVRSVRIGPRLAIGFLLVLGLAGLGASVSAWTLGTLGDTLDRLVTEDAARLALASELEKGVTTNLVRSQAVLQFTDEVIAKRLQEDVAVTAGEISRNQQKLESITGPGESKERLETVAAAGARYEERLKKLMEAKSFGDDMNSLIRTELAPLAKAYSEAVQSFVAVQKASRDAARTDALRTVARTRAMVAILLAAGVVAALLAAFVVARSIVGPVKAARQGAERIVSGDLTLDFVPGGRDELTDLVDSLARMQQSLRSIAFDLREAGASVLQGSSEIATENVHLSERTEEQSSTLEETAASLEELASTVKQNAESARMASQQAGSASRVASQAGELVDEVVSTMADIQKSARQIADISNVVNMIAFQTNILALNAAVEAARAGSEGRGFAVVAAEVRSLAQRSAQAAKEIQALIGGSVARIEGGTRLVDQAGSTMATVLASVQEVTQSIEHIAHATHEQNAGIGQVNQAMTNLEKVTQHNAALVSRSAAAAEGLRRQASRLQQSAAFFKLGESAAPPPAPAPREDDLPSPPLPATDLQPARLASVTESVAEEEWKEF